MVSRRFVRMIGLLLFLLPAFSFAGVFVSITIAPPALPVYVQPPCPAEGYIWVPGYWAWGPDGYYWVPGVWVAPPRVGLLWTPPYWSWSGGVYVFHPGYWGPHVGFYGGINYGFGYTGVGFWGGYWSGGHFFYNTAVSHVNTTVIRNVYTKTVVNNTVINNVTVNRVSYNGGPGGIHYQPSAQEVMAAREAHIPPTPVQVAHHQAAASDRTLLASVNHGRPAVAAMRTVNERRAEQQQRIAQGIASGQMTPREAARTENQEARINREVRADRQANGGRLTPAERNHVERQQNRESREIYKEKHNEREAPR